MTAHGGRYFTTKDEDHDGHSTSNCAQAAHGAWWYYSCYNTNLNGWYQRGTVNNQQGVAWIPWKTVYYSLKTTEMKIRPTF